MVLVLIFALLFTPDSFAANELASAAGELDFDLYFGPTTPAFKTDYKNDIRFQDDVDEDNLIDLKLQSEVFELNKFLQGEFTQAVYCPNEQFLKNYDYIYYLSRLLTISYLFEAIRAYEYRAQQLGDHDLCQPKWRDVFSSCQAKSTEMKLFIKNSDYALNKLEPQFVPLEEAKKSAVKSWVASLRKNPQDLTGKRIRLECRLQACQSLGLPQVKSLLESSCKQDLNLLKKTCSEDNKIYGVSNAPELYPLLLRSNAIRVFESPELAAGCLRRFIDSGKKFEWEKPQLTPIFSVLYSQAVFSESKFERGRLFPIGALREFREKGLAKIFEDYDKEVKEKKVVKTPSKKLDPIVFETIKLPKYKKPKKKVKEKKTEVVKKEEVVQRKSSFLVASEFREQYDLSTVSVDMNKFKYDFVFTLDQQEKYNPVVQRMSTINSLTKMKKQDKVGTKKAPFPLRFLKYMIDKEMHQNLFNIIQVVGDRFFVRNDIDKGVKKLDYVELKNDVSTQYQWQMVILSEP
ncbi:MAG: hypothetical protein CME65_00295 [Halobacteriovoraceae bacterium]|nr:hypothetical protein [Halobacteriovoraceae bacterium]|tara:strand:+ start:2925 stop:4478 length:1554 start_codon:yes stop_codon:yes gene_type:complete